MKARKIAGTERRGMDRRVFVLEQRMQEVLASSAVTEAHVAGLVTTMESRHSAFEAGQKLILEKLKPLDTIEVLKVSDRIRDLEAVRNQASGAVWILRTLGITGIAAGIMAIVKMAMGIK